MNTFFDDPELDAMSTAYQAISNLDDRKAIGRVIIWLNRRLQSELPPYRLEDV